MVFCVCLVRDHEMVVILAYLFTAEKLATENFVFEVNREAKHSVTELNSDVPTQSNIRNAEVIMLLQKHIDKPLIKFELVEIRD